MFYQANKFLDLSYKLLGASAGLGLIAIWLGENSIFFLLAFYSLTASFICAALGNYYRNNQQQFILEIARAIVIFLITTFFYF